MEVPDSEGLANHTGPESCGFIGNGKHEAVTGEGTGRVLSPEIARVLGADALRTRGRQHRRRCYGEAKTEPVGSETAAWTETLCAEPGRPCLWPGVVWSGPHGEPTGYARDARVQGVGQLHSTAEAFEQRLPKEPAEEVEGRELAKGNVAVHTRDRTQGRGIPVTGARPRTAGIFGCLRVTTRGGSPVR